MKRAVILLMVVPVLVFGAANKEYKKAMLLDITVGQGTVGVPAGQGTLIVQHKVFQLSVKFDDLVYTAETRSKEVRQLVIGDPVEARLDEKNLYIKLPDGKEIKAKILTKARVPKEIGKNSQGEAIK